MTLRTYQINDYCVTFYELHPFRNHSKVHYTERQRGWVACKNKAVKRVLGVLWKWLGVKIWVI